MSDVSPALLQLISNIDKSNSDIVKCALNGLLALLQSPQLDVSEYVANYLVKHALDKIQLCIEYSHDPIKRE